MKRQLAMAAVIAGGAIVAMTPAAKADELGDLKAQLNSLKAKVDQLESAQGPAKANVTANADQAAGAAQTLPSSGATNYGVPGGFFRIPGTDTSVHIGGIAILEAFHAFTGNGPFAWQAAANTTVDGSAGANKKGLTQFTANYSRFFWDSRTPTSYGDLKTYIELDLASNAPGTSIANATAGGAPTLVEGNLNTTSNSYAPRLRHAYGELGGFLAGQTWTLFADPAAWYETTDWNPSDGVAGVRQAQFRYTAPIGQGQTLAISVENGNTDYFSPTLGASNNKQGGAAGFNRLPDFIANYGIAGAWGHAQLHGLARELHAENGSTIKASAVGYALSLTGHFNTVGTDRLYYNGIWGKGVGRYIFDVPEESAVLANNTTLNPVSAWSFNVGYKHFWTPTLRTNFGVGHTEVGTDPALQAATATAMAAGGYNRSVWSGDINLMWDPVPQVTVGTAYVYDVRKVQLISTSTAPNSGKEQRLEVSTAFKF